VICSSIKKTKTKINKQTK